MTDGKEVQVIHDHSIELHRLVEAGEAVYVELEGQAAHERLQNATQRLKVVLADAKAALAPIADEVADIRKAVAEKQAEAVAAAAQQRHDDYNADGGQSKSTSGPAPATTASKEPADPTPTGGTIQ